MTKSFLEERKKMISVLRERGIEDPLLLDAFNRIPREHFLPASLWKRAYDDCAIPLAEGQSLSQPYVIALMLHHADVRPNHRVLEIGAGTGYVLALLSRLVSEVYGVELDPVLTEASQMRLQELHITAEMKAGNGYDGWSEKAPFDRIIVSAAAREVPRALVKQLAPQGKLILPFGDEQQELVVLYRDQGVLTADDLGGVRFVELKKDENS